MMNCENSYYKNSELIRNCSPSNNFDDDEMYVYADFNGKLPSDTFEDPNLNIKIIGFDSTEPIIQINNKIFKGTFEHTLGTHLFFNENPSPPTTDSNYDPTPEKVYQYLTKATKVLKMNRIFIERKEDENNTSDPVDIDQNITVKITKNYQDALNQFLEPDQTAPRNMTTDDDIFFKKFGEQADKILIISENDKIITEESLPTE